MNFQYFYPAQRSLLRSMFLMTGTISFSLGESLLNSHLQLGLLGLCALANLGLPHGVVAS